MIEDREIITNEGFDLKMIEKLKRLDKIGGALPDCNGDINFGHIKALAARCVLSAVDKVLAAEKASDRLLSMREREGIYITELYEMIYCWTYDDYVCKAISEFVKTYKVGSECNQTGDIIEDDGFSDYHLNPLGYNNLEALIERLTRRRKHKIK